MSFNETNLNLNIFTWGIVFITFAFTLPRFSIFWKSHFLPYIGISIVITQVDITRRYKYGVGILSLLIMVVVALVLVMLFTIAWMGIGASASFPKMMISQVFGAL